MPTGGWRSSTTAGRCSASPGRCTRRPLKLDPNNPEIHCDRGYSFYLQSRWAEAEQSLRRAIALRADHRRSHINLGLVLARDARPDQALEEFRKGGCGAAAAHTNLAFALTMDSRWVEAREQYRLALVAGPGLEPARTRLRELETIIAVTERRAAPRDDGVVTAAATATARAAPPAKTRLGRTPRRASPPPPCRRASRRSRRRPEPPNDEPRSRRNPRSDLRTPNDEIRMTKDARSPNDEGGGFESSPRSSFGRRPSSFFRHSCFGFRHPSTAATTAMSSAPSGCWESVRAWIRLVPPLLGIAALVHPAARLCGAGTGAPTS